MDVPAGYNDDITLTTPSSQVFSIHFDQSTSNTFLNHLISPTSQENVFSNQTSLSQTDVVSPVSIESTILQEEDSYYVYYSPNGSQFWRPKTDNNLKPVEDTIFKSWEDVVTMYYKYAEESGFSVRKGQTKKWKGVVTHNYLRCNKYGTPQSKRSFDSLSEPSMYVRQKTFTVTDCKAHVGVSVCCETCNFILSKFVEDHNHCLVDTFNRDLTKISRKLSFSTKKFIHQMSLNRVGPTVAHSLLVSINGGHHNIRGTPIDFKNFYNGKRIFIVDRDSHFVIDRLKDRYECCPELFFYFTVENGKLRSIFWADEISNYKAFGNVLAFDATYQTNRYKNDICSFYWRRSPQKNVSGDVIENTIVRFRIHHLVWNTFITPDTFESRCHYLIEKLSRFESSNATFKVNSTRANTVVQFMLCMESRLDSQRYSQRSCEYKTSSVSFKSTTGEEIEKHAFELYTQTIFNDVRKEIMKGKYCCYVTNTESVDAHVLYSMTNLDKRKDITNVFLVNFDPADNSASCSCIGFTRIGFLCHHVFCVYRIKKVDKIPLEYMTMNLFFEEIIGNDNEGDDFIENSDAVRIKGCGKVRRVMGESEKIVEKAGKVARLCRTCGEYVYHDSRNCSLNPKNKKKKSFAEPESSDNV
ncbi:protein FAR1-RELATED SEQUENCE 5-like [Bidens hawaiensis]|uniref:protein FAR1-RELATED SEQUENCE 5-like n=1 Tax=Bidens hawaiensis TaxID=980011 RepID=UPI00404ACE24